MAAATQGLAWHSMTRDRVVLLLSIKLSAEVCPNLCCRCQLKKNLEECIVGMSSSSITLNNCCLKSSEGPAIDMTGTSVLRMSCGTVQDCVGEN